MELIFSQAEFEEKLSRTDVVLTQGVRTQCSCAHLCAGSIPLGWHARRMHHQTTLTTATQQAALDISDYADAADVPIVRFVDVEDALSPAFERPALIVLPPQPLCRLGPPVLDQNSPLPTCEEDAPAFYLEVRPRTQKR